MLMQAGIFNLGFIGVGRRAVAFLDWWHERLRHDAVVDPANAVFTDQRWSDWVPSLFDARSRRPRPERRVLEHSRAPAHTCGGRHLAGGRPPLKFFHFSGYDVEQPWRLSKHAGDNPRCQLGDPPLVAELCHAYRAALNPGARRADVPTASGPLPPASP